jgi:hypothetical protein
MYGDELHAAKTELAELRSDALVNRLLEARKEALENERKIDQWQERYYKAESVIQAAIAVLSTVLPKSSDLLELCEAARVIVRENKEEIPF